MCLLVCMLFFFIFYVFFFIICGCKGEVLRNVRNNFEKKRNSCVLYVFLLFYFVLCISFLFYFFSQIKQKVRIHPIQYLIIGLAICLFFTLLIALSEHMNFQYAYFIGSIAIISIITSYSFFIFKDKLITSLLAGILIMLYGFIYVIIQMQDFSLLIGSLGLFVILSSVMYLSRNIDWYNIGENNQAE